MTPVRIRAQPCATTSGCSQTRRDTTEKMRTARKIRADARPRLRLAPYLQHSAAPSRSALHWRIDEKLSPSRASCRCRVRRLMPRRDATWSLEAWCETSKSCTTQRPCSLRSRRLAKVSVRGTASRAAPSRGRIPATAHRDRALPTGYHCHPARTRPRGRTPRVPNRAACGRRLS